MSQIKDIKSREIIDSRGVPTLETIVMLDDGVNGIASIPSGASTGIHEAVELRDKDPKRFHGKGVLHAVRNVENIISKLLKGKEVSDQVGIDRLMIDLDGTKNKSKLGANAILSVSLAVCRAAAKSEKIDLFRYLSNISGCGIDLTRHPAPQFNVINGGLHGTGNLSIQEFIIIVKNTSSYSESLELGVAFYQDLKKLLKDRSLITSVGDEGGFTPQFQGDREALEILTFLIQSNGLYRQHIHLGLDLAASVYYRNGQYLINGKYYSSDEYLVYLLDLLHKYQLISMEDLFPEDNWAQWSAFMKKIDSNVQVVGDDLLVTNRERLVKAIKEKACNSILIKLNQIGSLSETLDVIKLAQKNNIKTIISHRSGETNDSFIADLAVAVNADMVKFGAPTRGERVAKYNRLLEIYQ
ncbi:phosphopyruvate hydratase [Candidatus Gottesmanbacteria bacterium]|nr:phosphopyruvate hydratase [Candidatus Gottesmanbacteria bacterium]